MIAMTTRTGFAFVLGAWLAAGTAAAQQVPVVAMVTDVQGSVSIVKGGKSTAPTLAAELSPTTRIEVKDGARLAMIELSSGDELLLVGPATAEVRAQGLEATPKDKLA